MINPFYYVRPSVTISAEGEISVGIEAAPKKPELSLLVKDLLEIPQKAAARAACSYKTRGG